MSKILALIDGSVYAESVCGTTGWAATRTGLAVDVAHVIAACPVPSTSAGPRAGQRSALLEEYTRLDEQHGKPA